MPQPQQLSSLLSKTIYSIDFIIIFIVRKVDKFYSRTRGRYNVRQAARLHAYHNEGYESGGGVLEHQGQARTEGELESIIKELASMGYSIYSWNKQHSVEQGLGSVGNVR